MGIVNDVDGDERGIDMAVYTCDDNEATKAMQEILIVLSVKYGIDCFTITAAERKAARERYPDTMPGVMVAERKGLEPGDMELTLVPANINTSLV